MAGAPMIRRAVELAICGAMLGVPMWLMHLVLRAYDAWREPFLP